MIPKEKKVVSIIGGGAAALVCAYFLDPAKYDVTIYEKNKALARKFLVAGKGGFNLTHSEPIAELIERYTPSGFLREALLGFDNTAVRNWLSDLGIPTYIGSSKRVYPEKEIKPIEVFNSIIAKLNERGVQLRYEHTWTGWNDVGNLKFNSDTAIQSDYTIFALGGASWKITGSDGNWTNYFKNHSVITLPFQASNCAYQVDWSKEFLSKFEGVPLKNIAIDCNGSYQKGEVVITQFGLEGNAIYALSPQVRAELSSNSTATIHLDLKPNQDEEQLLQKLENSPAKNTADKLRTALKLSTVQVGLIKEIVSKEAYLDPKQLVQFIKRLPLDVLSSAPLDEAISTVGGIALTEVDANFELSKLKHHYCIGEMLDWDAPTGGYLLQACFSMGHHVAQHLNK
ncbi:MAG: TIGR03862 family flavoprotein [Crocinitomicaceae bacterium]|nr:TIGR03862 family flavoprotein [Crocinitomicaceae bacterium]